MPKETSQTRKAGDRKLEDARPAGGERGLAASSCRWCCDAAEGRAHGSLRAGTVSRAGTGAAGRVASRLGCSGCLGSRAGRLIPAKSQRAWPRILVCNIRVCRPTPSGAPTIASISDLVAVNSAARTGSRTDTDRMRRRNAGTARERFAEAGSRHATGSRVADAERGTGSEDRPWRTSRLGDRHGKSATTGQAQQVHAFLRAHWRARARRWRTCRCCTRQRQAGERRRVIRSTGHRWRIDWRCIAESRTSFWRFCQAAQNGSV